MSEKRQLNRRDMLKLLIGGSVALFGLSEIIRRVFLVDHAEPLSELAPDNVALERNGKEIHVHRDFLVFLLNGDLTEEFAESLKEDVYSSLTSPEDSLILGVSSTHDNSDLSSIIIRNDELSIVTYQGTTYYNTAVELFEDTIPLLHNLTFFTFQKIKGDESTSIHMTQDDTKREIRINRERLDENDLPTQFTITYTYYLQSTFDVTQHPADTMYMDYRYSVNDEVVERENAFYTRKDMTDAFAGQ
jgi:hypothetical protein